MSQRGIAKFYKDVDVAEAGDAFVVRLDGKPIKTPHRAVLAVPKRALAEAITKEWRDQAQIVDPATMPLTRLAYAAIDIASAHRARLVDEILAFGRTDLLCYRAETPAALVARQAQGWDSLLDWAGERFGAGLATGTGIAFVEQPPESAAAFAAAVRPCDNFALVGLHGASSLLGSLVLALALLHARLDASDAYTLSRLDETFQAEAWGRDAEAEARAARLASELQAIERFLMLVGARP
ncbi:MAG: ATP12 family protein [Rhizomicrobium sp.]